MIKVKNNETANLRGLLTTQDCVVDGVIKIRFATTEDDKVKYKVLFEGPNAAKTEENAEPEKLPQGYFSAAEFIFDCDPNAAGIAAMCEAHLLSFLGPSWEIV